MEELERIAIAIMNWKTPEGKRTMWGSDIIHSMMMQALETGRVCLEIDRK